jgi:phage repressor protein C with HTH and peptisase S24 domain
MTKIDGKWLEEQLAGRRGAKAELARYLELEPEKISKVVSGIRRFTAEEALKVMTFFGVDPVPQQDDTEGHALVPVYNVQASAGSGAIVSYEEVVDRLAFPAGYLRHVTKSHPKNLKIIGVKGDSMQNTLKDDDLVMIDTSKTDLSFEGLFVIKIDGGAALLVKRIGRSSIKGHIKVISDNPAHPAVDIAAEDVTPVGKVVWAGVKI